MLAVQRTQPFGISRPCSLGGKVHILVRVSGGSRVRSCICRTPKPRMGRCKVVKARRRALCGYRRIVVGDECTPVPCALREFWRIENHIICRAASRLSGRFSRTARAAGDSLYLLSSFAFGSAPYSNKSLVISKPFLHAAICRAVMKAFEVAELGFAPLRSRSWVSLGFSEFAASISDEVPSSRFAFTIAP